LFPPEFFVIASEAKQSSAVKKKAWIAASLTPLAMTAEGNPYAPPG